MLSRLRRSASIRSLEPLTSATSQQVRRRWRSIRAGRDRTLALAGAVTVLGAAAAVAWRRRPGASLAGQVALVTGGSRGLGYLIARELLGEGCSVIICGRDVETLERAVRRLSGGAATGDGRDARVAGWPCDVGDGEAVLRLVDRIMEEFGRLDIVVNNAGIIQVGPLRTMRLDDFHSAMDTDYWGAVHTTLAVLPHMRKNGAGRIVNITSIASDVAVPHLVPYVGAKHAKLGLSDALRAELAAEGIAVTTVVPGLMRTGSPMHVEFRGQPEKEYAWFTLGDILPLTAMSADRAARRIVRALRRSEARVTLSWQAKTLRMIHALAPATTARGMSVVNRLLPSVNGDGTEPDAARGTALRGTLPAPAEWALERFGARSNQR